jgi:hypothetical protein
MVMGWTPDAYHFLAIWNVAENDCVRADHDIVPNLNWSKYLCSRADSNVVSEHRLTFVRAASVPDRDPLVKNQFSAGSHLVAHYNPDTMHDRESRTDARRRMEFGTGTANRSGLEPTGERPRARAAPRPLG